MIIQTSAIYLSLFALLIIFLAFRVVRYRQRLQVGLGAGNSKELEVAIRCHMNALEYAPLILVLMIVAEINGLSPLWLHICGIAMLLGRLAHTWGMTRATGGYSKARVFGTAVSWAAVICLALTNLATVLL